MFVFGFSALVAIDHAEDQRFVHPIDRQHRSASLTASAHLTFVSESLNRKQFANMVALPFVMVARSINRTVQKIADDCRQNRHAGGMRQVHANTLPRRLSAPELFAGSAQRALVNRPKRGGFALNAGSREPAIRTSLTVHGQRHHKPSTGIQCDVFASPYFS
jgi:hypothetical protein